MIYFVATKAFLKVSDASYVSAFYGIADAAKIKGMPITFLCLKDSIPHDEVGRGNFAKIV